MLKHIVMWKLKNENRESNAEKIKDILENLKKDIEDIVEIKVYINCYVETGENSYDVLLDSDFNDAEGLNRYQNHPSHIVAKDFIVKVVEKRSVIDYYR